MVLVRPMLATDVDAVRTVDAAAFGPWLARTGVADIAPRTRENVLYRLARDPDGCFVAEVAGQVVGLIFSCTWGSVGWFGAFAVLPDHQGQGIGRQLLAASVAYLRRDPARLVGLETMPESAHNVGLYMRAGFQPRMLTLHLVRPLPPAGQAPGLAAWSQADAAERARWLADLREAAGAICPGLDYSKEIVLTAEHAMGETLLLLDGGKAVGAAVVVLASQRDGWGGHRATLQLLALHPAHTGAAAFHTLLAGAEGMAAAHGRQEVILPVYTGHGWAAGQLLQRGYHIERTMVRMVLPEIEQASTTDRLVELSRWAG